MSVLADPGDVGERDVAAFDPDQTVLGKPLQNPREGFRFDRQPGDYRETVLPPACRNRVAVEAGVPHTWFQYVGLDGKVIGINRFGLSAPGDQVMEALGCTVDAVIASVKALIG